MSKTIIIDYERLADKIAELKELEKQQEAQIEVDLTDERAEVDKYKTDLNKLYDYQRLAVDMFQKVLWIYQAYGLIYEAAKPEKIDSKVLEELGRTIFIQEEYHDSLKVNKEIRGFIDSIRATAKEIPPIEVRLEEMAKEHFGLFRQYLQDYAKSIATKITEYRNKVIAEGGTSATVQTKLNNCPDLKVAQDIVKAGNMLATTKLWKLESNSIMTNDLLTKSKTTIVVAQNSAMDIMHTIRDAIQVYVNKAQTRQGDKWAEVSGPYMHTKDAIKQLEKLQLMKEQVKVLSILPNSPDPEFEKLMEN